VNHNADPACTVTDDPVAVRALVAPTHGDIEALAEIFDRYRAHYGEGSDGSRSACWLEENLTTSRLRAFVAEERGTFIGFAVTMEVPASLRLAHFWQIKDLYVVPTHRRRGVGRALLACVRTAAISSGALRLVLQTEEDNDPALRLYTDCGYALIDGYCSLMLPFDPETQGS
jgi:ribosomal protein S18 acetylase RimI-like enzyme